MSYILDIDPDARAQIQALPPTAVTALADAMTVLSLVPERGQPLNANNPDGGLYQTRLRRLLWPDHLLCGHQYAIYQRTNRLEG